MSHDQGQIDASLDEEIEQIVNRHKVACRVGSVSTAACTIGCSKKGGLPDVDEAFEWPTSRGRHLSFLAQIKLSQFTNTQTSGVLQFFWSQSALSSNAENFRVLHTADPKSRLSAVPESETNWFGLFKRKHTPKTWAEEALEFQDSYCLPSPERLPGNDYNWDEYDRGDLYHRQVNELTGFFQIEGVPNPVQADNMEESCAKKFGDESPENWQLLLQIDSSSDMMWGDAGKLYWFIRGDDLAALNFSDVHMEMQCH